MRIYVIWSRGYEGPFINDFDSREKAIEWINCQDKEVCFDKVIEGRELQLRPVEIVKQYEFAQ
jgi:hypothetical protein